LENLSFLDMRVSFSNELPARSRLILAPSNIVAINYSAEPSGGFVRYAA
jgi:hypothetical protein